MNHALSRRIVLAQAVAILAGVLAPPAFGQATQPTPRRPNVLWICPDQQRWDTIHALGNKYIRTPNIDRLVAHGVAFTHAFCQSPICTPSRAAFLTGRYPSSIRACINGNDHWANGAPLITKTLADAGYDCGLAGKLHLSAAHERIERRPDDGYRVFHWSHHPYDDWPEGHDYINWLRKQGLDFRTLHKKHGFIPEEYHQTTWCGLMAMDFFREHADDEQPWLFSFNCFDPHNLYDPPGNYLARFDIPSLPGPAFRESDVSAQEKLSSLRFLAPFARPETFDGRKLQAQYWAQIELIDHVVGQMVDALEKTGQLENTVIIYMSDHGDILGDHGLQVKGCRFYEPLVRVPLVISWPGRLKQGLVSDALVELIDIPPTLLELAGLPPDPGMAGKSLWPILTGQADPRHHRDFVRSEYFQALFGPPSYGTMFRDRRYKLVNYHGTGLGELFDLQEDPGEFNNLWDDPQHADVRFQLMVKSFDSLAFSIDTGPPRVGRF